MGFVRRSSGMAEAKEHERNQKRRRESRYLRAARIAYAIAQEALPRYSHPKSPHIYTLPQLAACVLPGFTTLYRAYRLGKDEAGPVGEAGERRDCDRFHRVSPYPGERLPPEPGRTDLSGVDQRGLRGGDQTQLILAWGPGSDAPYLHGLKREIRRYGEAWLLLADSGFDGAATEGT